MEMEIRFHPEFTYTGSSLKRNFLTGSIIKQRSGGTGDNPSGVMSGCSSCIYVIHEIWEVCFMNISKFTQKSIEAVNTLEKVAYQFGHQEIEEEHLLYALYHQ